MVMGLIATLLGGGVFTLLGGLAVKLGFLTFLPGIVSKVLLSALELLLRLASGAIQLFFQGSEAIFGNWKSAYALAIFMLAAGFIGDRYDPVRDLMAWPAKQGAKAPERSTSRAEPRASRGQRAPARTILDDVGDLISRNLSP